MNEQVRVAGSATMQAAKDLGYDVTLRYVAVNNVTMNIRRVEGRAMQGGH